RGRNPPPGRLPLGRPTCDRPVRLYRTQFSKNAPGAHGPKSQPAAAWTAGGQTIMTRRGRWLLQPAEPSASCHDDHADSALVLAGPRRSAQGCFWRGSYTLSEKYTVL